MKRTLELLERTIAMRGDEDYIPLESTVDDIVTSNDFPIDFDYEMAYLNIFGRDTQIRAYRSIADGAYFWQCGITCTLRKTFMPQLICASAHVSAGSALLEGIRATCIAGQIGPVQGFAVVQQELLRGAKEYVDLVRTIWVDQLPLNVLAHAAKKENMEPTEPSETAETAEQKSAEQPAEPTGEASDTTAEAPTETAEAEPASPSEDPAS